MNRLLCRAFAATLLAAAGSAASAGEPEWIEQFGTWADDTARSVAVGPDGRVHVVGSTSGPFYGVNKGGGFVVTFDRDGTELWRRQPGTTSSDDARGVATDADGNVYVVGSTSGALGGPSKGGSDVFVIKFDRDGHYVWKRQPGTPSTDGASAVATDADGNVYVVGLTYGALGGSKKGSSENDYDAFVLKFDRDGRIVWKRQPGTSARDYGNSVATDADGNVYVVGLTYGALGGSKKGSSEYDNDAFVLKFDRDGHSVWKRQPGTLRPDSASAIATDSDGNVYVVGFTYGALDGAYKITGNAFLLKFDRDGNRVLWSDQPGRKEYAAPNAVATDADGNVYVAGATLGTLGGDNKGAHDAFVIKFDRDGTVLWSDQQGTTHNEYGFGVATDVDGNAYVVGRTEFASLPGHTNLGQYDAFLVKYGPNGPQ